jgi:uncharacterized protein (TIGR02246 family)
MKRPSSGIAAGAVQSRPKGNGMSTPEERVAIRFVEAINAWDADTLAALMTDDHTFVDSMGMVVSGKEVMRDGWKRYYEMFPDYRVVIEETLAAGKVIALFGSWAGTFAGRRGLRPENKVGGPAAWRATVERGKIKRWQVYADHTNTVKVIEADS